MDACALLDAVEHETGPSPAWSVLWLHALKAHHAAIRAANAARASHC